MRGILPTAVAAMLVCVAYADTYRPILRVELVKANEGAGDRSHKITVTNVRYPTGTRFEVQVARFDTISIQKDGTTVKTNIFCDCGTIGMCGAPVRTLNPGESAEYLWDGLSDLCEAVEPGKYLFTASLPCPDPSAIHREICKEDSDWCSSFSGCYEYHEDFLVEID